jgi:tetratricopeptide (TPR) repeat protein
MRTSNFSKAERYLRNAIDLNAKISELERRVGDMYNLGQILYMMGRLEEADEQLRSAVERVKVSGRSAYYCPGCYGCRSCQGERSA